MNKIVAAQTKVGCCFQEVFFISNEYLALFRRWVWFGFLFVLLVGCLFPLNKLGFGCILLQFYIVRDIFLRK